MPGAKTSVTVHIGIRCRQRYHERHDNCRDQAAVEDAAGSHEVHDSGRVCGERVALDDQQEQLGADERADDDPDAEIHDPVRDRDRAPGARTSANCRPSR